MATWQFDSQVNPNQTLPIPPEVANQLAPNSTVHVLLMCGELNEDAEWRRLAAQQFLNGYAPGDAIYDDLPTG
jgi:hypothetical protein